MDRLPGQCTALEIQKKNPGRVSLFVDHAYLHGFHREVVEQAGLHVGQTVTAALLEDLLAGEQTASIRSSCYAMLSQRDHTRGELQEKLVQKGFEQDPVHRILQELQEKGYLDNRRYALQFTEEKLARKGWGPEKIRAQLYRKGVEKSYIDEALQQARDPGRLRELMLEAVNKRRSRFRREADEAKRKQQIAGFLLRKGFPSEQVWPELERLNKSVLHEESDI